MTTKVTWLIDPLHSTLNFKVKHLAIASVSGVFKIFNGHIQSEGDDFNNAEVRFEMNTNSLDTNNPERDKNLVSDLFLNAEKFPVISLTGFIRKINGQYKLDSELTILGTTNKVVMEVAYGGTGTGFRNDVRAGFEITGKINRKDFGLNIHVLNDAGDLVIGNEVNLNGNIEIIKQTV